jgi:hypothetical protein
LLNAARQQLTVNCSSRGYARMIEAHADPRSEALCRSPKRGGGAQITDATRRERELRGELVRCKIVPYGRGAEARRCAGGARGARAHVRAPACSARGTGPPPRSGLRPPAHDHRNKRMILWKYYICLRQCRSTVRAHASHAPLTCHTLNTQHFTDWTDRTHRSVHARHPGRRCTSRSQCLLVPQSRVPGSAHGYTPLPPGPGAEALALHNEAQGQGRKATTHMAQGPHARSGTLYPKRHTLS